MTIPPGTKGAFDWGKRILTVASDTQKNATEIKELRGEMKELRQEFKALTSVVEELYYQQRLDRKEAQHEHEKQEMRLKIALLEAGHRLPELPTPPGTDEVK